MRVILVMPVKQRIIEPHFQSRGAKSLDIFLYKVAFGGRVCSFVIGVFAVEKAKTLVMLGGKNRIFHAGIYGYFRPFRRVVPLRRKRVEIFCVLLVGQSVTAFGPFVFTAYRIKPPMNKHSESVATEIFRPFHYLFVSSHLSRSSSLFSLETL